MKALFSNLVDKKIYHNKERRENSVYNIPVIRSEEKEDISEKRTGKSSSEPEIVISEEKEGKSEIGTTVHDDNSEGLSPGIVKDIISRSDSRSIKFFSSLSTKDLYFHFYKSPIFIDNGTKSISIDERSRKICCMIGAKGLTIEHGEASECWQWKSLIETSRFSQVAESKEIWFLHIKGQIRTNILSTRTTYGVYFVYKLGKTASGFQEPVELYVKFKNQHKGKGPGNYLDLSRQCQDGREGWREIEMGEFFIEHGDNENVVCILMQNDNDVKKTGLIVDGIQFRPKDG